MNMEIILCAAIKVVGEKDAGGQDLIYCVTILMHFILIMILCKLI